MSTNTPSPEEHEYDRQDCPFEPPVLAGKMTEERLAAFRKGNIRLCLMLNEGVEPGSQTYQEAYLCVEAIVTTLH